MSLPLAWAGDPEDQSPGDRSPANSSTEDQSPDQSPDQSGDEYSFNWLDPDKKIYVLQNRKYVKAGHPLLSALGGMGFSEPYRTTYNLDGRFAYYISESWGVEIFYAYTWNSPNNTYNALLAASGSGSGLPEIREIHSRYGGMIQFVPWYAKINVFNSIIYFDWYFGLGAGGLQTFVGAPNQKGSIASFPEQDLMGIFFSTGHLFHLFDQFVLRLDVTGTFYQAQVYGSSGDNVWYSNYNFGLGLGWRF